MTRTKKTVVLSALIIAASLFGAIAFAPAFAVKSHNDDEEIQQHNHIKFARAYVTKYIGDGQTDLYLKTEDPIAKNGEIGSYGYGVITDQGFSAVMVATTHAGVKDSEAQKDASDPVWHTHYVKLGTGVSGYCGENPEVVDITFQEPAEVKISGKNVRIADLPASFTGTHSLTGGALTVSPGTNVVNVVAFHLMPVFEDDDEGATLKAVCVHDVMPAETVSITTVFKNEE